MSRVSMNGRRIHVMLTSPQLSYLKMQSKATGLTVSDLIRRAVDADIYRVNKAKEKRK